MPVRAFWSVSVDNRRGFFEQNDLGRYSVNSVTAQAGDDGTVTINFGGDPSLPNHIPIMDGWNYVVRLYQPEPQILDGSWTFPGLGNACGDRVSTDFTRQEHDFSHVGKRFSKSV